MLNFSQKPFLSSTEVRSILKIDNETLKRLVQDGKIQKIKSPSGQWRYSPQDVMRMLEEEEKKQEKFQNENAFVCKINESEIQIWLMSSENMIPAKEESVHLIITSPPYFNAKTYSPLSQDIGNSQTLEEWLEKIEKVWRECFRVLRSGRKFFINIMNLPVRIEQTYKTLNLVGKTIDLMENIGFIFKRDIIWEKTNGPRASFGSYPYPGGILINNMHEFILEFEKPSKKNIKKCDVSKEIKEKSKLEKDFWLSIKNSDVWKINPEKSGVSRDHAAPFPVEIPERLIKAYSFVGETVLDPFIGSGTTAIACAKMNRNCIGFELSSDIFQKCCQRLLKFQASSFSI